MAQPILEFEGTWEEILARSSKLAGRRVNLTVMPEPANGSAPLSEANHEMLETSEYLRKRELTDEEIAILDDFDEFRRGHPFSLRHPKDEP